jgi:hypothetical protein
MMPLSTAEEKPMPTIGDNWTEVLADRRVTFRLLAPNAGTVSVLIGLKSAIDEPAGTTTTGMAKDTNGLWTATLGPFEPDLYEYQFNVDEALVPDPGNDRPKPQRHVDTSLLLIPGDPPTFLDVQNVAHGTVHEETYYSSTLGKSRRLLVYTPRATTVPVPRCRSFTSTTAPWTRSIPGSPKDGCPKSWTTCWPKATPCR